MNFRFNISTKTILKVSLIALSILLWVYFYIVSGMSLNSLIVFNAPLLINTLLTVNFLIFLLIFPITTAIAIALSTGRGLLDDLLEVSSGIALGIIFSLLIFHLDINFFIFGVLYLIAHVILSLLTYNKFKDRKNIRSLSFYASSKIGLLLSIVIFIFIIIVVTPHQQQYSQKMEASVVNMFVGDDFGGLFGTSYSIGKMSTKNAVDFITTTPQYQDLKNINDSRVQDFVNVINNIESEVNSNTNSDDYKKLYADLDNVSLKNQIFTTINQIPLVVIFNKYFAILIALLILSFLQIYFAIAFSLIGLLYIYLLYKLFKEPDQD